MRKKTISYDKQDLIDEVLALKERKHLQWLDIYRGFPNDFPSRKSFVYAIKTGRVDFLPDLVEYLKQIDNNELTDIHKRQRQRCYYKDANWLPADRISRTYAVEDNKLVLKEECWK